MLSKMFFVEPEGFLEQREEAQSEADGDSPSVLWKAIDEFEDVNLCIRFRQFLLLSSYFFFIS